MIPVGKAQKANDKARELADKHARDDADRASKGLPPKERNSSCCVVM